MALEGACASGKRENLARKISLTWYMIAVSFMQSLCWQGVRDEVMSHLTFFYIKPQFQHPSSSLPHIRNASSLLPLHVLLFK